MLNTANTLHTASRYARVVVEPLELRADPEAVVMSFAAGRVPAILETTLPPAEDTGYSVFACDPMEEFVLQASAVACPFRAFARHVGAYPTVVSEGVDLPFVGGWIGYFTYEAGLTIEKIGSSKEQGLPLPMVHFCLYDTAAIYDHQAQQWYAVAVDWPQPLARRRPGAAARLATIRDRLAVAAAIDDRETPARSVVARPVSNMSHSEYFQKVERVQRYIEAGDVYQVNLAQRFIAATDESPLAIYRRLRHCNPAPYGAFLPWGSHAILSSSPELFLRLRSGHVVTRPIKGTRPRGSDPQLDAVCRRQLADSEKDKAELTMIIDLLRNDLGKVCRFGSVRVTEVARIEQHPTVFHRVATIEGDLAPERSWADLLLASCPGGSVTGAPKIRAMQIIEELEPDARGVYCGSIGMIGLDGTMTFNLAIRTMVRANGVVHFHAGSAIVADSQPEEEYEETLAKAAGMMHALSSP